MQSEFKRLSLEQYLRSLIRTPLSNEESIIGFGTIGIRRIRLQLVAAPRPERAERKGKISNNNNNNKNNDKNPKQQDKTIKTVKQKQQKSAKGSKSLLQSPSSTSLPTALALRRSARIREQKPKVVKYSDDSSDDDNDNDNDNDNDDNSDTSIEDIEEKRKERRKESSNNSIALRKHTLANVDGVRKLTDAKVSQIASQIQAKDLINARAKQKREEGIICQIKLDGDRLQAHIFFEAPPLSKADAVLSSSSLSLKKKKKTAHIQNKANEKVIKVCLFTKNGYDVTELYSDVAEELRTSSAIAKLAPCILDGELVLVKANTGEYVAWESEKWRYNRGIHAAAVHGNSKPIQDWSENDDTHDHDNDDDDDNDNGNVLLLEYGESEISNADNPFDDEGDLNTTTTFLQRSNANAWVGPRAREERRARLPYTKGCCLRFVVFDLLMFKGQDISMRSCATRLSFLEEEVCAAFSTSNCHHITVIEVNNIHISLNNICLVLMTVITQLCTCHY